MFQTETFNEALRSLWSSKQRTLLALLGIVIGIGSVIAMVSIGVVVRNEALKQFTEMGTDIVAIQVKQGGGRKAQSLQLPEALDIPENCPGIRGVAPYTSAYKDIKIKGKTDSISMMGVTRGFFDLCKLPIAEGRAISDLDVLMFYCVISEGVRARLEEAGVREALGHKLFLAGRLFTVVGVMEEVSMNMMRPWDINEGVFVPVTTALRMQEGGRIDTVIARLAPDADWRAVEAEVQHYVSTGTKAGTIDLRSAEELIEQIQNQMRLFTMLLGAVGSISLVVGGVGVMNVMLISVAERKREIGIRRALGARRKDIQAQFLIESVCLCLAGGFVGICLGVGASWIIANLNNWEFMISWMAVILGVGVSCLVGVFFGFYPARQAARMSPIDALRGA